MRLRPNLRATALLTIAALAVSAAGLATGASAATGSALPPHPGDSRNHDVEPLSAVAGDGTIWVASTDGLAASRNAGGLRSGSDIWRSTDGGKHFSWVAAPFAGLPRSATSGGGETDIAAAPVKNSKGYYNVYATSIEVLGSSISLGPTYLDPVLASMAFSQDDGKTWSVAELGGTIPEADRSWVVADGACEVHVVYHALYSLADTTFMDTYDLCNPVSSILGNVLTPITSTQIPSKLGSILTSGKESYFTAGFGKPVMGTARHSKRILLPIQGCAPADIISDFKRDYNNKFGLCNGPSRVIMASSDNGGLSWQESVVAVNHTSQIRFWPVAAAVDPAGTAYITWTDDHLLYLASSRDGGTTWSRPTAVTSHGLPTATLPALVATGTGHVAIAFYGTSRDGDPNSEKVMGKPGSSSGAAWVVDVARSYDGGHTFTTSAATEVVHRGAVCVQGGCNDDGDTDLGNTLGLVSSRGALNIAYSSSYSPGRTLDPATLTVRAPLP